jgi:hypothetical protein
MQIVLLHINQGNWGFMISNIVFNYYLSSFKSTF